MTRVLLISEACMDFERDHLREQLVAATEPTLAVTQATLPPTGATPGAVRRLQQSEARHEFDVIHALGPAALLAAAPIGCRPIVYSPPPAAPARHARRLRTISTVRQVRVVCSTPTARAELLAAGVDPKSLTVLAPIAGEEGPADSIARQALDLDPDHRVLLAVGESTRRARHDEVIHTAMILWFVDPRYRLVLWGRGDSVERVRRFDESLKQPGVCIFAEQTLDRRLDWSQLIGLADAAIDSTHGGSILAALQCRASGLPIFDLSRPRDTAQRIYREFETLRRGEPSVAIGSSPRHWATLYRDVCVGRVPDDAPAIRSAADLCGR